jgi:hypothetical protein
VTPLVHTTVARWLIEALLRTDAVIVVLVGGIGFYLLQEFIAARLKGECDRPLQLVFVLSAWMLWVALEFSNLLIARAATLSGQDDGWVLNARWRLLVPSIGVILGLSTIHWLANGRWWVTAIAGAVTVALLLWPEPVEQIAMMVYWFAD